MKFTILFLLLAVIVALASGKPAKGSTKAALKKTCKDCKVDVYKPLCAQDEASKPITFGSKCVLERYNCENKKEFVMISEGECSGSAPVRLS